MTQSENTITGTMTSTTTSHPVGDTDSSSRSHDNLSSHPSTEYDQNIRKTLPCYEFFHEETIDLIKTIKPDVKVWLDTGCGTGHLLSRAYQHFPHTFFILADPSCGMLHQARKRFQEQMRTIPASTRIRFLAAGTQDLPTALKSSHTAEETIITAALKSTHTAEETTNTANHNCTTTGSGTATDQQPDIITAIQCHHFLRPQQRQIATQVCFNLLARGGTYITFENVRPDSDQGLDIGIARWKRFQVSQGRAEEVVEAHGKRLDRDYFPITIGEHLSLLKECGFSVAELFWYSYMQAGFYAVK
ncbi:MAG: class I SAM-dependent methyltransferase [bacterium]